MLLRKMTFFRFREEKRIEHVKAKLSAINAIFCAIFNMKHRLIRRQVCLNVVEFNSIEQIIWSNEININKACRSNSSQLRPTFEKCKNFRAAESDEKK